MIIGEGDIQENIKAVSKMGPVKINGENYDQGIIVIRKDEMQLYYLHEAITLKK